MKPSLLVSDSGKYICLINRETNKANECTIRYIFKRNGSTFSLFSKSKERVLFIPPNLSSIDDTYIENALYKPSEYEDIPWNFLLENLPKIKEEKKNNLPYWMKELIILKTLQQ